MSDNGDWDSRIKALTGDIVKDAADRIEGRLLEQIEGQINSLRELLNQRFSMAHDAEKRMFDKLDSAAANLATLATQSAVIATRLEAMERDVVRLSTEVNSLVPRVRELEKQTAASAPIIGGARGLATNVLQWLVVALLGIIAAGNWIQKP